MTASGEEPGKVRIQMGGLNEADRLKRDGGLDARKASVTKLPLGQLRVATEGAIAHPRAGLPADPDLVRWIAANGMRSREGTPWRFLAREQGKVDDVLDVVVGNGSRRHKAGTEAERILRETAPRTLPLTWDKADPTDLGRLYVEVELFDGTDAEFVLARIAANSEPGKLPDSAEVLALQVLQLHDLGCDDLATILAVMPAGVGKKEVQALARWRLLTPAARARFVGANLPPQVLPAVLDAPPAEQLGVVEVFVANGVTSKQKADHVLKKAREAKTGEPATKARRWQPKKLAACAGAIKASLPAREGSAGLTDAEEAAEARGFAKALLFAAGEKTGRLPRAVTAAIKSLGAGGAK